MKKPTRVYPHVRVDATAVSAVGQAGGVLLTRTADVTGLSGALREALATWRKPLARHDPAKVVLDLAISLALGGDCLADAALMRCEPGVYGSVASEATISRTIAALAKDADAVLAAIAAARKTARSRAWALAAEHSPDHDISADRPLVIDLDATLITSHSEKEQAAATFKRGIGSTPCWRSSTTGRTAPGNPWP